MLQKAVVNFADERNGDMAVGTEINFVVHLGIPSMYTLHFAKFAGEKETV